MCVCGLFIGATIKPKDKKRKSSFYHVNKSLKPSTSPDIFLPKLRP